MTTLLATGLALVLAIGTGIGVAKAVNSSSSDRATPGSSAPVYGSR